MPYPQISPVLNNCPFYALTPEIKEEILNFAADDAHDNGHNAQYNLLKEHFSAYYGIDPLSWKDFGGILNNYNPFDLQIVLGPVLRSFSKEMMEKDKDSDWIIALAAGMNIYDVEEYIKASTEINVHNGRYDSLNPDHMFRYLASPLGLSLTYEKTGDPKQTFDAVNPVAAINVYHQGNIQGAQAGGHWERTAKATDAVDYQSAADTQLTPLLPVLGDNAVLNSVGINLLKQHVQLMHRYEKHNYDITSEVQDLMLTGAQVHQYMWNMNFVLQPLAVELLGKPLTTETLRLINDIEYGVQDRDPRIQNYLEAAADRKPYIQADAKEIIDLLTKGVVVPQFFIPPVKVKVIDNGFVPVIKPLVDLLPEPVVIKGAVPKVQETLDPLDLVDEFPIPSSKPVSKTDLGTGLVLTIPHDKEEEAVKTSPIRNDLQIDVDEYIEDDIDIDLVDPIAHQPPIATLPIGIKLAENKPKLPDIKDELKKKNGFDKQLIELWTQVKDLKTRRDDKTVGTDDYKKLDAAYGEAKKLHGVFKVSGNKYFNKEISYADFKKASNEAIINAKPILETHRGWKEVLNNIGQFLNNLLGSIFKEKVTFFQVDTTSMKKVKALEESVNNAAPEALTR